MAMTIVNNPTVQMTLGELNKNVSKLGKQLSKLANGQKIAGAGDGTSDYSISERMQAQIRSLKQDIDNTKTGRSMLQVAEGGIQGIVDELREMKQLTINAANDSNTDADRATIQKEFDEKLKQIDDIVATTNYNGKLLLNGEYGRWQTTAGNNSSIVSAGVFEPTGDPIMLASGNHTITSAGVYMLEAGFSGDITIADGLLGVKITQVDSSQLTDVHIIGPSSGNANLWIDGLNVKNTTDQSWIRFSGSDNVLSMKGSNRLNQSIPLGTFFRKAMIHIGDGLTIEGAGDLEVLVNYSEHGAIIGTDRDEFSSANLTINSGTYILTGADAREGRGINGGVAGALIGSGYRGSIGNITVNGGRFDLFNAGEGSNLGSGGHATAGDITIRNTNFTGVTSSSACIGSGDDSSHVGNITIEESIINVDCRQIKLQMNPEYEGTGAGIGSGTGGGYFVSWGPADAGDITIRNSTIYASSIRGAGIGSGWCSSAGDITIENVTGQITSKKSDDVGKGEDGTIGVISISGGSRIKHNPLIIHTGTKANQHIDCYIENLGTKALFNVKTDEELEKLANVRTRDSAQRLLGSLTDPSIEGPLDKAINYALNEVTQVGAYIKRLEQTEDTLTINQENTTSSESTIRDADMAKEMLEYTRSNVLTQAAQSMLAQANQNSRSVLSLLQ